MTEHTPTDAEYAHCWQTLRWLHDHTDDQVLRFLLRETLIQMPIRLPGGDKDDNQD